MFCILWHQKLHHWRFHITTTMDRDLASRTEVVLDTVRVGSSVHSNSLTHSIEPSGWHILTPFPELSASSSTIVFLRLPSIAIRFHISQIFIQLTLRGTISSFVDRTTRRPPLPGLKQILKFVYHAYVDPQNDLFYNWCTTDSQANIEDQNKLYNNTPTEDPILMLFVDFGLAICLACEVLGRDLFLRRPLLVKLAAHLQKMVNYEQVHNHWQK